MRDRSPHVIEGENSERFIFVCPSNDRKAKREGEREKDEKKRDRERILDGASRADNFLNNYVCFFSGFTYWGFARCLSE